VGQGLQEGPPGGRASARKGRGGVRPDGLRPSSFL